MDPTPIVRLWNRASQALPPDVLSERYLGVMLGTAVGNSLGIPVEGASKSLIRRRYPGGIRDINSRELRLPWDDDLAQSVLLAEAMLATGPLDLGDLAARLVAWRRENGRGIGNLTSRVLDELENGCPAADAAERVWRRDGRGPAGNGAVMRCAPVALRWFGSPRKLVEETIRSAQITHYDPRCQWSAVAANVALSWALRETRMDLAGLASALEQTGAPSKVAEAVCFVEGRQLADLELDEHTSMGYTLKAMQVGLWALQNADDFEERLIEVVGEGGDTDTNGAVAGAMLGCVLGESAIPKRWLDAVSRRDYLEGLAQKLARAAHLGDLGLSE